MAVADEVGAACGSTARLQLLDHAHRHEQFARDERGDDGSLRRGARWFYRMYRTWKCRLDVEEYREGGRNGESLQFPTACAGRSSPSRRAWAPARRSGTGITALSPGPAKRRDGLIVLLNDLHLPAHIWHFRRGLPTRYAGPTLNAAQSAVAIESIEISHEGIYQVPGVGYAAAGVSAAVGLAV